MMLCIMIISIKSVENGISKLIGNIFCNFLFLRTYNKNEDSFNNSHNS